MHILKKTTISSLLVFVLILSTWSPNGTGLSMDSVLMLSNPFYGRSGVFNIQLFSLHMGLVLVVLYEINTAMGNFFCLESYIMSKKEPAWFILKAIQYAVKRALMCYGGIILASFFIATNTHAPWGYRFGLFAGSVALTIAIWILTDILLRTWRWPSRNILLVLLFLIIISAVLQNIAPSMIFSLCPGDLFEIPLLVYGAKLAAIMLLLIALKLQSRTYESRGKRHD